MARAPWEPKPDLATAAEAWLLAGGSHHTVLSPALGTDAFADLAGIELVVIDEDTRMRRLTQKLRWNQAYYHLAGGL